MRHGGGNVHSMRCVRMSTDGDSYAPQEKNRNKFCGKGNYHREGRVLTRHGEMIYFAEQECSQITSGPRKTVL